MDAVLVYNPNSGPFRARTVTPDDLTKALNEAGFHPVYRATKTEAELDGVLEDIDGLVVAAGGDGTLRAVATRLLGKNIPITPIPMGTSNNVCSTLGIQGTPLEIVAGLKNPCRISYDVGQVRFPWGDEYFLEGMGFGIFADSLAFYHPEEGKSIVRSIKALFGILSTFHPHPCQMSLDGRDLSGAYLAVEALNTPLIGPSMRVAPEASPSDGLLDVYCIRPDSRDGILNYLRGLLDGKLEALPSVQAERGKRLDILWEGNYAMHVDAGVHPDGFNPAEHDLSRSEPSLLKASEALVSVEILPHAIELWLPGGENENETTGLFAGSR